MLELNEVKVEREIGGRTLSITTGVVAKQAAGAVFVRYGDTVVLSAVCIGGDAKGDFFPLMVDYREKMYAAGKFPGGFFKREARPSTKETLVMRLTDRPIRPLFPKGFMQEVVITGVAMSADGENDPDILSMTGAAAAVCISKIPFAGPMAGVRVGQVNGELVINPTESQKLESNLDLVIAGTAEAVTMVEAGGDEISEDRMIEALEFGHAAIKEICAMIAELQEKAGKEKMEFSPPEKGDVFNAIHDRAKEDLIKALLTPGKFNRSDAAKEVKKAVIEEFVKEDEEGGLTEGEFEAIWEDVTEKIVRKYMVESQKRIDGRDFTQVREIDTKIGMLPCTHGSSLFTRGETQAMVVATLGTKSDEQTQEGLYERIGEKFYLHYNFPGYCTGEAKMPRSTSRRELGHGALAQRALSMVMPHDDGFPYTIRLVSEIMESNGSSSMASVCGGTLALMDAGVPIKRPVAGIAMGLIKEENDIVILSDILGDEDHYGDMDFKVTGTQDGITALQMDIKCTGLSTDIMKQALAQAKEGRMHILREMLKSIQRPREDISPLAPRMHSMMINPDLIGKIIGPGGKTIRAIQEDTGVKIDIEDTGEVCISTDKAEGFEKAIEMIKAMTAEPVIGQQYKGTVKSIKDFGCFVEIIPGIEGLVHISELDSGFVKNVADVVKMNDEIDVKIIDIDNQGRIKLSRKALMDAPAPEDSEDESAADTEAE
ncbi:MAG: polyribonucleotide nucleotidyltransferase [Planctomycetota bacterium]|jgi:polyribonucleotide nucleotidyltransferase